MNKAPANPSEASRSTRRMRFGLQLVVLIVVFVSGAISGAMLAAHKARIQIKTMMLHPEKAADHIVQELITQLSLNERQATQIAEIVKRRHTAMVEIRRESSPRFLEEFDEMESETLKILNDDQKEEFRRITEMVRGAFLPLRRTPKIGPGAKL